MFSIDNLASVSVSSSLKPWEFTSLINVPIRCLGKDGKKARHDWMTSIKTKFHAYSLFEGTNSNGRVSRGAKEREGNPPTYMHGIAADYDFPLTDAEVWAAIGRMDIKPTWWERTLSGNVRLVWMFSRKLPLPSFGFAVAFLEAIDKVLPIRQLAGLDEGALKAPERMFTNGCIWRQVSKTLVSWALLQGAWLEVSRKFDWKGPEFGVTIPLDVVAGKLREKYPRFAEWDGDFTLDSMGPTFWVDGSVSSKSAIVRETGMQTFAGHAHKAFFSWSELIGADFCDKYKTEQLGKAVEGIYYDEKSYYSKNAYGVWCIDPKENIIGLLKHERGMSDLKRKGESMSELERALVYIQRHNRVKTAASFAFFPEGMIDILGDRSLNIHTKKALEPCPEPAVWGPDGNFPWLSNFFDNFFTTPDQLPYFLSWLSYFYKNCYHRSPRSGQALFIGGGTSVGKTFLTRGVIGSLVGGFAEAQDYLLGRDKFNGELCDCALWVIDDNAVALDHKTHKAFSEGVKRTVANPSMKCNNKFLKACTTVWLGRLIVTFNTDLESMGIMPNMDLSLKEKIMVFRAVEVSLVAFMPLDQMERMLARELPAFARFLLDYVIPPQCLAKDPRFAVESYLEPTLMSVNAQSSIAGTFTEILEEWACEHFTNREPTANKWEGTALQLHKAILMDGSLTEAMKAFNVPSVGRMLTTLAAKKVIDIRAVGDEGKRIFTVNRDETKYPYPKLQTVAGSAGPSKFEKS